MLPDTPLTAFAADDRSVSTTLNYVLALSVATVLTSGLLIAGGSFLDDQQDRAGRVELEVLGQQLASDIEATDRLSRDLDGDDTVNVTRSLPDRVAGSQYTIRVRSGDPELLLNMTDSDVSVTMNLATQRSVEPTTIDGGDVRIVYDDPDLVVKND